MTRQSSTVSRPSSHQQVGDLGPTPGSAETGENRDREWQGAWRQNAMNNAVLARLTSRFRGSIEAHQQEGNVMTGVTLTSADLDPRRRRILFRCWHRGIREMDLVFGQFAEKEIAALSDVELDEFETIMAEEDNDLVKLDHGNMAGAGAFPDTDVWRLAAYKPDFEYPAHALQECRMIPGFDAKKLATTRAADDRQCAAGLEPLLLAELARAGEPVAYVLPMASAWPISSRCWLRRA
jgi:antitoxin CptB